MPFSQAALTTELNTDPKALGYASVPHTADGFVTIAGLLNSLTGAGTGSVFKATVQATDVQDALDPAEVSLLTAVQASQLGLYLAGGIVNSGSAHVRAAIVNILPSATFPNTRANLTALASRTGSRAEVLFGAGVVVSPLQVQAALGL